MNEFQAIGEVLKSLGVSSLFAPLLTTLIIFYLLRKYVLAGAGDFLKTITTEYLKQQHERVVIETKIDLRLNDLIASIDKYTSQIIINERRYTELIEGLRKDLCNRMSAIELEINDLRETLIEHEIKVDSRPCIMQGGPKYQMDTEKFRKKRELEASL